jgi:hypothetical protein
MVRPNGHRVTSCVAQGTRKPKLRSQTLLFLVPLLSTELPKVSSWDCFRSVPSSEWLTQGCVRPGRGAESGAPIPTELAVCRRDKEQVAVRSRGWHMHLDKGESVLPGSLGRAKLLTSPGEQKKPKLDGSLSPLSISQH